MSKLTAEEIAIAKEFGISESNLHKLRDVWRDLACEQYAQQKVNECLEETIAVIKPLLAFPLDAEKLINLIKSKIKD